jgi:hypothetical protein
LNDQKNWAALQSGDVSALLSEANHLSKVASWRRSISKDNASMSKNNPPLPPALEHDGRLNNSVAPCRKGKRPNALKHGVFARTPLIPGEDPREFAQLHAELIDEWQPSGPTLLFALRGLADLMWRMHRLKEFIQTQLSLTIFDPRSPSFDEFVGYGIFMHYLRSEPETCFEQQASSCLRTDRIKYLEQKCPRSNYQSTSEWVDAVIREIISASVPAELKFDAPELGDRADELREASRQWETEQKVAGCTSYASEILEYDFKETERLEARIAKQTRYCAELKAMEEMRSRT